MFGYPLTIGRKNLNSIVNSNQFKIFLVSISVGVISGLFISFVRLNLGMPGHKAFFWMTPLLITRLRGGCKIGTTAGGFFAALTTYSLGANLAGGVIGIPLIAVAGMILDWTVNYVEKNNISGWLAVLILALAGAVANIVCLTKRMVLPAGINPHFIFGLSGFWFRIFSYTFFGLLAGVVAAISVKLKVYKQLHEKN